MGAADLILGFVVKILFKASLRAIEEDEAQALDERVRAETEESVGA